MIDFAGKWAVRDEARAGLIEQNKATEAISKRDTSAGSVGIPQEPQIEAPKIDKQ